MRFQIECTRDDSSSDSSDSELESDSGDEQRMVTPEGDIRKFDENFSGKRWKKLKPSQQKLVSAVLQLKEKDQAGKDTKVPLWTKNPHTGKSNRTLSVDRNHFMTCCRYTHTHTHTHTHAHTHTHTHTHPHTEVYIVPTSLHAKISRSRTQRYVSL